ncbi:MAG TPA: DUF362 domain-containing protein [Bryobacteraceae bacterium]|nr:DUF362 domain-containing protein [Bryobacteraceae bacterium]
MTRREWMAVASAPALLPAAAVPAPPVSIARCRSYSEDLTGILSGMFDQLGGLEPLVKGKTVTVKLNLTGSPGLRFQGKPLGVTHYSHPKTVGAMVHLMGRAGARRVRLVESCWGTAGPLEEYMLDSGWNVRSLQSAAPAVEFVNTNARGAHKTYSRVKVPGRAHIFAAYDLNRAYEDTDVFLSMAKLKNHATCGVTLAMKNCFGITPASVYGDDAGLDEPNESPTKGRVKTCHLGERQPSKSALSETDSQSPRQPGYRMPRITAELAAARPIGISFIDGVETIAGGEGPWIRGLRYVQPGLLILGTNPVTTDTVATAAMGYDPRAQKGTAPFVDCDNTLLLAESLGVGSADLKRIEVRGLPLVEAMFPFQS